MAEMTTTRDDLRDVIAGWPIGSGYYSTQVGPDDAMDIADAVLAAGFRRRRVITDPAELEALILTSHPGTVIRAEARGYGAGIRERVPSDALNPARWGPDIRAIAITDAELVRLWRDLPDLRVTVLFDPTEES